MKNGLNLLLLNTTPILFGAGALYLIAHHLDGWGWFIFIALLNVHYLETKKDENSNK